MLKATKVRRLSSTYDITADGRPVTRWEASVWRSAGTFTLEGRRYRVRSNAWGSQFTMTDEAGTTVATAGKVSRREWTVAMAGQTYAFRRPSWWRNQFDLVVNGQAVGGVRRISSWRTDVEANLPNLPLAAQVFTVGVALLTWEAGDTAAVVAATS
jgi:hypothetical protein